MNERPTEKPCRRCNVVKPLSCFSSMVNGYLGLRSWCKTCMNIAQNERRARAAKLNPVPPRVQRASPPRDEPAYRRDPVEKSLTSALNDFFRLIARPGDNGNPTATAR